MKKSIVLIALILLSCSSDDENSPDDDVCCNTTVSAILASYDRMYGEILASEDLTEQQRTEAEAEYRERRENPCESYKRYVLEAAGATCSANP